MNFNLPAAAAIGVPVREYLEKDIKKIATAFFAIALCSVQASAQSIEEPTVAGLEVVEQNTDSAGWLVPLTAIGIFALFISEDDTSYSEVSNDSSAKASEDGGDGETVVVVPPITDGS